MAVSIRRLAKGEQLPVPVSLNILPQTERKYRFAVTPLADAMFQLLIFFMLSSNMTPYTLLPLKSAEERPAIGTGATTAPDGTGTVQPRKGDAIIWIVEAEAVLAGGQKFDFDSLTPLAEALAQEDKAAAVVLVLRPTAQVQDVATVLGRLKAAGIERVQISGWR